PPPPPLPPLFPYPTLFRSSPLRRVRGRGWNGPCPGRRAAAPAFFGSRHSRRGAMLRGLIGPSTVVARLKEGLDLSSASVKWIARSEEHTSELQSRENLVCR